MANNTEPQEPKGIFFVWFPAIGLVIMVAIAAWQCKSIEKIASLAKNPASLQMAVAGGESNKRGQLIECYAKFGIADPTSIAKLNALTDRQVNDLLYECNKQLSKKIEQGKNGKSNSGV